MELMELIMKRRSIRRYTDAEVSEQTLKLIL